MLTQTRSTHLASVLLGIVTFLMVFCIAVDAWAARDGTGVNTFFSIGVRAIALFVCAVAIVLFFATWNKEKHILAAFLGLVVTAGLFVSIGIGGALIGIGVFIFIWAMGTKRPVTRKKRIVVGFGGAILAIIALGVELGTF